MKNPNRLPLGLRIRKDVHRKLKALCAETGRSMAQEAEWALELSFIADKIANQLSPRSAPEWKRPGNDAFAELAATIALLHIAHENAMRTSGCGQVERK